MASSTNISATLTVSNFSDNTPSIAPLLNGSNPNSFFVKVPSPPTSLAPSTFAPTAYQDVASMAPTGFDDVLKFSPQLSALGLTLGVSLAVFAAVLFGFAVAMRCRSTNIAPRCEARPRNVIYNPDQCADPCQRKGNPFFLGWVGWVMRIPYKQMLGGVNGTGTRQGGMKGRMLNVNLDHIILLRFNSLGLKISIMSMLTYCTICLPIYFYSRCPWVPLGDVSEDMWIEVQQNCTNQQNYTFSSYSRFTLANVPELSDDHDEFLTKDYQLSSFLLYMVSIASWIVAWYSCFELFHEWIDEVAIRRVYYLEYNHWKGAKDELKATMLDAIRASGTRFSVQEEIPEKHLFDRKIWIPHPEQRDTPSNVELYSVLVGGIPSRPDEAMNHEDVEAALANTDSQVDWQMSLVSAFFDSCVPNQPGFSSSLAAVTILPSARELATAWQYWYKAAKRLSRLRFIRRRIIELGGTPVGQKLVINDDSDREVTAKSARSMHKFESDESLRRQDYTAEVLGAGIEDDANDEFWKSLDLGPEQIAVYSMEFSRGLAGCCPHGFCEQRVSYCKDLDTLLEMESEMADLVTEAYQELKAAGDLAATSHEKRKEMLKITDVTTDLLESKPDMPRIQSTTEMKLMEKRRFTHLSKRGGDLGRNKHIPKNDTHENGVSFRGVDRADSEKIFDSAAASEFSRPTFESGLMRRASAARLNPNGDTTMRGSLKDPNLWDLVENIASESKNLRRRVPAPYKVQNGKWSFPTLRRAYKGCRRKATNLLMWTGENSNEATDLLARDSTFAVVTFTSRQAAIAARQCLADGRGAETFTTAKSMPVPPLADSSAFNICDCRGFMKPVTIGLNEYQKQWRKTIVTILVIFIFVFYTIPIGFVSEVATRLIFLIVPDIDVETANVRGWVEAQVLSLFLAFLPDLFLFLANFGSNATSLVESENAALRYYWFFMVCFAMIGSSIVQMGTAVYNSGSVNIVDILQTVARTIPVEVSFTWTNWIITKGLTFTPAFYLLQLNTFLAACFGAKCCVRMFRGGGSGNRLPYRIYVENGTVLLCSLALAPTAPLLSPFAVLYFLVCSPLLRYVLIFVYKPPFDSGGSRWPFLFNMIITSMVVAQVILCTILFLKQALGAAIFAAIPIVPILMFWRRMRNRFLQAYLDAALLQTSMLDGWDVGPESESESLTWRDREEYRRFVVDAHKASYVPVCIAATQGGGNSPMTAEPAVVVPTTEEERHEMEEGEEANVRDKRKMFKRMKREKTQQFGAINRRHLISTSTRNLSLASAEAPDLSLTAGTRLLSPDCSMPEMDVSAGQQSTTYDEQSEARTDRKESDPSADAFSPTDETKLSAETPSPTPSDDDVTPPMVEPEEQQSNDCEEVSPSAVEPEHQESGDGESTPTVQPHARVPYTETEQDAAEGGMECHMKVTRLGTIFTLENGEVVLTPSERNNASDNNASEKQKEE